MTAFLAEPRIETEMSACARCARPAPLNRAGHCWHCARALDDAERPQMHVDDARSVVRAHLVALTEQANDLTDSIAS